MTADEKIKEVMKLIDTQTGQFLAMQRLFLEGKIVGGEDAGAKARSTRDKVEAKLRELIKDDAPTSLTVNLKVEGIEPLKGLIDLLRQHQDQLPKEIVEYCLGNFGGEA